MADTIYRLARDYGTVKPAALLPGHGERIDAPREVIDWIIEEFRKEVQAFLAASWPPSSEDAELSRDEQTRRLRQKATDACYLNRRIPKQYGGSEQPRDAIKDQIIREEFGVRWVKLTVNKKGAVRGADDVGVIIERGERY